MEAKKLAISKLVRDAGTQSRERLSEPTIVDYAEDLENGAEFPPVNVFSDGKQFWLADGFHRVEAHERAGKKQVAAIVTSGTLRDAQLFAFGCNSAHGLKRTNRDKRKCVSTMLLDHDWAQWSIERIAETCGVSVALVHSMRVEFLESKNSNPVKDSLSKPVVGKDGKQYPRQKRKPPESVPPVDEPCPRGGDHEFDGDDCEKCHEPAPDPKAQLREQLNLGRKSVEAAMRYYDAAQSIKRSGQHEPLLNHLRAAITGAAKW